MSYTSGSSGGTSSINSSQDVALSNPANNELLTYNTTVSKWVNRAPLVSSVNGSTGVVQVTKAGVGLGSVDNTADIDKPVSNAVVTMLANALRLTDANAFYAGSAYPLRTSVTSDNARRVRWIGPTAPTIGSGYAINNLDVWEQTA